jgi:hypothetical protein
MIPITAFISLALASTVLGIPVCGKMSGCDDENLTEKLKKLIKRRLNGVSLTTGRS